MFAFCMQEVHTKCFHLFCLREGSGFVLGLDGAFFNTGFNLELVSREVQRRWLYWDCQEGPGWPQNPQAMGTEWDCTASPGYLLLDSTATNGHFKIVWKRFLKYQVFVLDFYIMTVAFYFWYLDLNFQSLWEGTNLITAMFIVLRVKVHLLFLQNRISGKVRPMFKTQPTNQPKTQRNQKPEEKSSRWKADPKSL